MAKEVVVNPAARLEPRESDVALTNEQFLKLSLFSSLKNKPSLDKFPGAVVLRRYKRGEVICRQGDGALTAFYILTNEDVLTLPRLQPGDRGNNGIRPEEVAAQLEIQNRRKAAPADASLRQAITVYLTTARPEARFRGGFLRRWFGRRAARKARHQLSIPIDAPVDIDANSMRATLQEGELFGEASCLYRTPRSATVIADRDCYLLELLRNVFDQIQKDQAYRARTEEIYRKRVLGLHLRRLSIFADLNEEQYARVAQQVELVSYARGQIIFDEYERPDSLYIVRTGLVRVVQKTSALLGPRDVRDWHGLVKDLLSAEKEPASPAGKVWQRLDTATQASIRTAAAEEPPVSFETQEDVAHGLNKILKDPKFSKTPEFKALLAASPLREQRSEFPDKEAEWSDQDQRHFNRLILEALFGKWIRAYGRRVGPESVLSYCSRGDVLGEMGLLSGAPRGATCLAHTHPEDLATGKDSGRVELVRLSGAVFQELVKDVPAIRTRVERLAAERQKENRARQTRVYDETSLPLLSEKFQQLGLVQGQRLMLIDLDRCTRCDECVRACVNSHDDGYSRLFLDGPRFEKYLVPTTCRSCLEPVCMIGCPVGSIHRGDNGQIAIEDWCIGCGLCAKQCPYGSILMQDVGIVPETGSEWQFGAVTEEDTHWAQPRARQKSWPVARSPVRNERMVRETLEKPAPAPIRGLAVGSTSMQFFDLISEVTAKPFPADGQALGFRHEFEVPKSVVTPKSRFRIEVESQGAGVRVWLNGQPLEAVDKPKRGKQEFKIAAPASVRAGTNLLAIEVNGPVKSGQVILAARLDEVCQIGDTGAVIEVQKLVTETAVVCDLCSSQRGQVPACVNACPHDAAMRVDARSGFPGRREAARSESP